MPAEDSSTRSVSVSLARLDVLLDAVPPASGAVVMGTGIVSIATALDGQEALSRIFLALDALIWLALVVLLPARALRDRARFRLDVRSPAAFTSVAGTCVLGTRFTLLHWTTLASVLLVIALLVWLGLLAPVLRHWSVPTTGVSFIVTVGTESLAMLAAAIADTRHADWLLGAALFPFALGLVFYAIVLSRFKFTELAAGRGDHWVTGGALAISTVTAGRIALAIEHTHLFEGALDVPKTLSLVLWVLAIVWLPALLIAELRWRRPAYYVRRWSTVFPVGMYAACSFIVAEVTGVAAIKDFASVWVWVGVAVWLVVATGLVRAAGRDLASALARR